MGKSRQYVATVYKNYQTFMSAVKWTPWISHLSKIQLEFEEQIIDNNDVNVGTRREARLGKTLSANDQNEEHKMKSGRRYTSIRA